MDFFCKKKADYSFEIKSIWKKQAKKLIKNKTQKFKKINIKELEDKINEFNLFQSFVEIFSWTIFEKWVREHQVWFSFRKWISPYYRVCSILVISGFVGFIFIFLRSKIEFKTSLEIEMTFWSFNFLFYLISEIVAIIINNKAAKWESGVVKIPNKNKFINKKNEVDFFKEFDKKNDLFHINPSFQKDVSEMESWIELYIGFTNFILEQTRKQGKNKWKL
ncbi:hypothetical protein [Williamsoniiplasma luminosum]|nr:hypothetical protein [Williamsoniiplasma luminosum]